MLRAVIAALLVVVGLSSAARAACPEIPPIARTPTDGSPFATGNRGVTRLDTQTSDNVRLTGGCIDEKVQLQGAITPQKHGAKGDGIADDTVAVQAWLTALKTGNYLGHCNGKFRLTASVNGYPENPYRMAGAAGPAHGPTIIQQGGCQFYVDYNDWTSAAIDLTNPSSPTTNNRGKQVEWDHFTVTYNTSLTAPPMAFRHRFVTADALHDFSVMQYTVNRGTCLSMSSAFNERIRNVQIWGCGGYASSHQVPTTTTFSISAGATTLTSSAALFSASDVGLGLYLLAGSDAYDEQFVISGFTNDTTVTVSRAAAVDHVGARGALSGITGTIGAASTSLTISADVLAANDVGRNVYILGAGSAVGNAKRAHRSTISGVSGTTITLANATVTACTDCTVIVSPAMEVYAEGTVTNDLLLENIHLEEDAGTPLIVSHCIVCRAVNLKSHAWGNRNGNFGANNTENNQFNAVFDSTDMFLSGIDIEGGLTNPALGRILLTGNQAASTILGISGLFTTGLPEIGLYNNHQNSAFTIGAIISSQKFDALWGPSAVKTDGTSTYGAVSVGTVSGLTNALTLPRRAPFVLKQSGAAVGNATSGSTNEVNLASVPYPPLGPNDAIRVSALVDTDGSVATNTKSVTVRLGAVACAPLGTGCSSGTVVSQENLDTAAKIADDLLVQITNANATNAQVVRPLGWFLGLDGAAVLSTSVDTSTGGFINIGCATSSAGTDVCKLMRYTIEIIPGA